MEKQEVIKFSVTDAAIAKMKSEYMVLKTKGVEDKKAFAVVNTARKHVKSMRVGVEKKRKEYVADAIAFQRKVNHAAKDVTTKLLEIENHLTLEANLVTDEIKRIKDEESRKRRENILNRQKYLIGLGASFDLVNYQIGLFVVKDEAVHNASEEEWEQLKNDAETAEQQVREFEKKEAEREEAEKLELQKIKNDQEKEKERLVSEQRRFEEEKAKLAVEKEEFETNKRMEEEKKIAIENAEKERVEAEKLAKAERIKSEEMKPDIEKIEALAQTIKSIPIEDISVSSEIAKNILNGVRIELDLVSDNLLKTIGEA